MIHDADTVDSGTTIDADLCVIGGGPAGLAIATHFVNTNKKVILLESGALPPSSSLTALFHHVSSHVWGAQSLTSGDNIGDPYYLLRLARMRCLGGTSRALARHGLRARPLDEIDFEAREGIDHSGWPIGRDHLDVFYRKAQSFAGLGPYHYNGDYWEDQSTPQLTLSHDHAHTSILQYGPRDFVEPHIDSIRAAKNVRIFTHANATHLSKDASNGRIRSLEVVTLKGTKLTVRAGAYVLAAGGIDNARILLYSNRISPSPINSQPDLVGRFFMEHPHLIGGFVKLNDTNVTHNLNLYHRNVVRGTTIEGAIRLRDEVLRRERLLNSLSFLRLSYREDSLPGVMSAWTLRRALRWGPYHRVLGRYLTSMVTGLPHIATFLTRYARLLGRTPTLIALEVMAEQQPNPHSRVLLSERLDRLGVPKVSLDWQVTDADRHSIRRSLQILGQCIERSQLGNVVWVLGDETPPVLIRGGWHHMGTTRMHNDPRLGVVDANCRVHGCGNLFVAGSSVFPTSGASNPTLTILALAFRLAEHLEQQLQ